MQVRRIQPPDLDIVVGLDRAVFPRDTKPDVHGGLWWAAYDDDNAPVAYAGLMPSAIVPDAGYLCRVGVLPHARGQGLQRRLIRVREKFARSLGWTELRTDTAPSNVASMRSLIRCGYLPFQPPVEWGVENATYWKKEL